MGSAAIRLSKALGEQVESSWLDSQCEITGELQSLFPGLVSAANPSGV
jgi:hypothetical protein